MKIFAKILCEFEFIHQWEKGDTEEHDRFLRWPHRHLAGVIVWIEQFPNEDRGIEYYAFRKWLKEIIEIMPKQKWYSCEDYCREIATIIQQVHKGRAVKIEVTEDKLEGAYCEYEKDELKN